MHRSRSLSDLPALASALSLVLTLVAIRLAAGATAPTAVDRVLLYLRQHYGVADNVKLTSDGLRDSKAPGFYATTVTIDDGKPKDKKTQSLYLTTDGHFLVLGTIFALARPDANDEMVRDVRDLFKVPADVGLAAAAPAKSIYPGFYSVKLTATNGRSQEFYLTPDQRTLVVGEVFVLDDHPEEYFRRTVSFTDQPSAGPAHAAVTVVEYADLECPYCKQMHQFLEHDFLPKYGDKVRVIFKEFPLADHQWAGTAALANECAYQLSPRTFLPYRTLIFQHQNDIDTVASSANLSTVRDMLLDYAEQAGINRARLAVCLDSRASTSRVEEGRKEGQLLGITRTPTFFINGRIQGPLTPQALEKAVNAALGAAATARARRRRDDRGQ